MSADTNAWAIGIIFGLCRVVDRGYDYPIACAPFVRLALKIVTRRRLDVHPNAIEFVRRWLNEVENRPAPLDALIARIESQAGELSGEQRARLTQALAHGQTRRKRRKSR